VIQALPYASPEGGHDPRIPLISKLTLTDIRCGR
jgi:hypothetical protein